MNTTDTKTFIEADNYNRHSWDRPQLLGIIIVAAVFGTLWILGPRVGASPQSQGIPVSLASVKKPISGVLKSGKDKGGVHVLVTVDGAKLDELKAIVQAGNFRLVGEVNR